MPTAIRALLLPLLSFLILALAVPMAIGQETDADFDPYPLRPAKTSSPRDTLQTFIRHFNTAADAWRLQKTSERRRATARAAHAFDFSELPAHSRYIDSFEKMALLKEILDRVEVPDYDQIPGEDEVADKEKSIDRWTIPNTQIEIARIQEGPRRGEFLFTKGTVAQLEEYYNLAKDLPYKPNADVNLYEELLTSPGPLIPKRWAESLPLWAHTIVLGNGIWQWLALALIVLIATALIFFLYRWGKAWDEKFTEENDWLCFGVPLALIGAIVIALLVRLIVTDGIWLFGTGNRIVSYGLWTVIFGAAAWLIYILAGRLGDAFAQRSATETGRLSSALVPILFRLFSIITLVFIAIYAAEFFGIPIAPLVAGLGVGALAVALSVQPTLENVIGGLTLFADKPVRIGDACRYGDKTGTVESIGLRSTRIRTPERELVTIPNRDFSRMQLSSLAQRDKRLYHVELGLRCETTPDQLRYVLAKLREMLLGHPRVANDPARVRFTDFGEHSLDLQIFAYVNTRDDNDYLAIREDLNLRIMDIVAEAGTDLASPTQIAYLRRDAGLDDELTRKAEMEVEDWRSRGQLPFPEFDKGKKREIQDILFYPRKGSPAHKPRAGISGEPQDPPPTKPKSSGR